MGSYALADALLEAKLRAAALGFGLLLWDGYRPQRAVDRFLEWSAQPEDGRTKQRFYPNIDRAEMFSNGYVAPRSGHSRGSAVDLTLYRLDTGEVAAMGGGHDLMDERSHHGATGVSARRSARTAGALCSIMEAQRVRAVRPRVVALRAEGRAVPRHLLRLSHSVGRLHVAVALGCRQIRAELVRVLPRDVGRFVALVAPPLGERADVDHVEAELVEECGDGALGGLVVPCDGKGPSVRRTSFAAVTARSQPP